MAAEAAAESFDAGDADARKLARIAVEYLHARVAQHVHQLSRLAGFEIVIAEHGRRRHPQRGQLLREHGGLLGQAVIGEIAGEHGNISGLVHAGEERLERALRRLGAMEVGQRGHTNDRRCHGHPGFKS